MQFLKARYLLMKALCARHAADDVALVVVGGYGRGELAPNSDIDLLFLTEKDIAKGADLVVEQMLYLLWDLGLKVGHAKRTVTNTMRSAREDHRPNKHYMLRTGSVDFKIAWNSPGFSKLGRCPDSYTKYSFLFGNNLSSLSANSSKTTTVSLSPQIVVTGISADSSQK